MKHGTWTKEFKLRNNGVIGRTVKTKSSSVSNENN